MTQIRPKGRSISSFQLYADCQHLPAQVHTFGLGLFCQQCWLWGRDVRRAEGNALIDYGFSRQRTPEGTKGSSAYRYDLDSKCSVVLWAFGMFYGDIATGGVYLNRYTFTPVLLSCMNDQPLPHQPDQLPPPCDNHTNEAVRALFCGALGWIVAYETWVAATLGVPYRQRCVDDWKLGPWRVDAKQIIPSWRHVVSQCAISIH